jgi:aminotransferase
VRRRPDRIDRLPRQYFAQLLARVAEEAARQGDPLVNFGRGNPEVGPPEHVIEAAQRAAADHESHGYPPFRGLPELREAVAQRYRGVYGVSLDPETEVAVVPGTKTAIVELALVCAERGSTIVLPDPGYPDYFSGVALAGAELATVPVDDLTGAPKDDVAALYLNFPSNPVALAAPPGLFDDAVRYARATGAVVVHDFAYGDLVFDGRRPESFLATGGAKDVGVEMFSMSKSYGMAGWRLGFVVGNAEIVERINVLQDHNRAGIFRAVQEAGIAALTGPQDSVEERRRRYEERRNRVLDVLAVRAVSEGTFYVWIDLPEGITSELLLTKHRVALAPGEGFGARGAGKARISVAVSDEVFERGLERLHGALE